MNILHLPVGATSHPTASSPPSSPTAKPTSCEGYVTKRGHFRKSWRVRYLVLNGADLLVSYFDSKEVAHTPGAVPKGSFYLSSVEKHEYFVGILGAKEKPFGFKLVGHAPRKGYVELDIFVETLGDLNKWLEVCQNALEASKKLTRNGLTDISTSKTMFGFSPSSSPQKQMQKLATSKEAMLKQAIQEIESAKLIGREACQEIVIQGEKLDHIETELGHVQTDLDHADKLLRHMKNPFLHMFSNDERVKPQPGAAAAPTPAHSIHSVVQGEAGGDMPLAVTGDMSDIERLASLLGELEQQATLLNEEAAKSTGQIERISEQLTTVNDRVKTQTKKANTTITRA
ncbi:hypothetical protein Poli38472_000395 [Pythium oligandrum]|uniref:PH domain-containing protein n=1 Tax=Pythium oligandrum TaxID=41045 RepID=A0A8K1CCZ9_PYTOL|nr:hypothetical protein Poli38472_000395 [Pythium oligandrum]|eukprot:TMW60353.1 hypothetical protein Poli38472_000395 [Pythium oligandrum]